MRYVGRTQGTNLQMLFEFLGMVAPDCPCALMMTESTDMVADIYTKRFIKTDEASVIFVAVFRKHVEYIEKQNAVLCSSTLVRRDCIIEAAHFLPQSDAQAAGEIVV